MVVKYGSTGVKIDKMDGELGFFLVGPVKEFLDFLLRTDGGGPEGQSQNEPNKDGTVSFHYKYPENN